MKVLIIGAHPDDEILGCGGVYSKLEKAGHQVFCFVITSGRTDKDDQRLDLLGQLEVNKIIEKEIEEFKPDAVFTHFIGDLNKDHQMVAEATMVACRPQSGVKEIYSYETPGSAGVSIIPFKPDTYFELDYWDLKFKREKMKLFYEKELKKYPHARSIEGIGILAEFRGSEINTKYAEAFMTIRRIR
jgi:LmbE family N-acetylglucosaminyl deacetylase